MKGVTSGHSMTNGENNSLKLPVRPHAGWRIIYFPSLDVSDLDAVGRFSC